MDLWWEACGKSMAVGGEKLYLGQTAWLFCAENYPDILHEHCGCLNWEFYWYFARTLWLFELRILLIFCTNIVAVWTENFTDILHEHCSCLHWELYWYSARTLWLFALRIVLISCTNIVAVCTENCTDILHEQCMYWLQDLRTCSLTSLCHAVFSFLPFEIATEM
jgi:hypothetical protein